MDNNAGLFKGDSKAAALPTRPDPHAPIVEWTAAVRAEIRSGSGLSAESSKAAAAATASFIAAMRRAGIERWPDLTGAAIVDWCAEPLLDRRGAVLRDRDSDDIRRRRWRAGHIVKAAIRLGAPVPVIDGNLQHFLHPPQRPTRDPIDPEDIAAVAAAWRPQRWRHGSTRDLNAVLPEVRESVLAAEPGNAHEARTWMRILSGFGLWAVVDRHSDRAAMHTPNNVQTWVMEINAHQDDAWKARARAVLRRLGPTVNPAAWPRPATPIPARMIVAPYQAEDERAFRAAALLPRRDRRARIWVAVAAPGAGLTGTEITAAEPSDLVERPDGRWEINVRGTRARRVPIRRDYLPLAAELGAAEGETRYVTSETSGAVHQIVQRIRVGDEGLSLTRARNTFLAAHLRAGTPPAALSVVAGGVSYATLDRLLAHVADRVDPDDAIEQALRA